ncbi:hypothetical protein MHBO_001817 [Bonamia ostreae]|uniref:Uncharacterized protein n=1 Tax=Bonamia ostreae TaxID=126728 RepID=A0ABV2AKA3_9EUKA
MDWYQSRYLRLYLNEHFCLWPQIFIVLKTNFGNLKYIAQISLLKIVTMKLFYPLKPVNLELNLFSGGNKENILNNGQILVNFELIEKSKIDENALKLPILYPLKTLYFLSVASLGLRDVISIFPVNKPFLRFYYENGFYKFYFSQKKI